MSDIYLNHENARRASSEATRATVARVERTDIMMSKLRMEFDWITLER